MILRNNSGQTIVFSDQEVWVTWLFMTGMRGHDIAFRMGLSAKAVSFHKRSAMKKAGVSNAAEFFLWFLSNHRHYQNETAEP